MIVFISSIVKKANKSIALVLSLLMSFSPAMAGIAITAANGIVMTGADGIVMTGADGIVMTGADGALTWGPNGIVMTGADGIVMTGADGIVVTGADGFSYPNSVRSSHADGIVMTGADGIVMTGADGIVMTGADGTTRTADSVTITVANGIVMTGADGIVMTGADGVSRNADGIVMTGADGIVMTGADGIVMTGADAVKAKGPDGVPYSVVPNGLRFAGVTGIVMTGADGIVMTGADGIVMTGADGIIMTGADNTPRPGLQTVDPELALLLNETVDDSSINAVVVYHRLPNESDLSDLKSIGIAGGTRFRALPMVNITGTRDQIVAISHLPAVRSIYGNRTLTFNSEPEVRAVTGVDRARRDAELTNSNRGLPVTGRNVTVAVLDTGIDGTHGDLSGRVVKNIKLADTQSVAAGFSYPLNSESLPNTDQLYGHGSFVAGIIAGNGNLSNGKFAGVAPDARLVGLSAGDLTLVYVLNGFDYLLSSPDTAARVVNCSFSANTVFDTNDPVNVATKMLTDAGVNVVFSAGNTGPGAQTLNPYAVAPWVVSVGATDTRGRLAGFSSRGDFASALFRPTLVAPGVNVVSVRGSGIANVTGAQGLAGADAHRLSSSELPNYTTANGTSFSAPQVAGAIALMLEANPSLTPAEVREILQLTATPLAPYFPHETGAGMLNVHAAVLRAEFTERRLGAWRGIADRGQVQFIKDPLVTFTGTVQAGTPAETTLRVPTNALFASVKIGWGPLWSLNDLSLQVFDPLGSLRGQANAINLTGLTGKRESVSLKAPAPGAWRLSVRNTLGGLSTTQPFVGVLEVGRARHARMTDMDQLSPSQQEDIYQSLRTFTMWPIGSHFRPEHTVSRMDLATALVAGARVPQYLSGQTVYSDVKDASSKLFVDSVQASPNGPLFVDAAPGSRFRPHDNVTRLVAAIAFVRAAGLRSEAEAKAGTPLAFLDARNIPSDLRGYVSVAISKGLLHGDSLFRPEASITRAELAQAIAAFERRAVE
ncbi:MAG TPA: S8 family serine peptidase [Pyrinomonadaceae bacterium]|nr:S8 family serine peptidase [Pyrinomonadaceae bacterium]